MMNTDAVAVSNVSAGVVAGSASRLDRLGIVASVACMVHCLVAPFLLLLLPAAGSIWAHPAAHWVLAVLVLPLAVMTVWRGYLHHRRRLALVAAAVGAALIVVGLVLPHVGGTEASVASTFVGSGAAEGHGGLHAEAAACTDTCCPAITQDPVTGALGFHLPSGGLVTLLGSAFLVMAHGVNIYGCRCLTRPGQVCSPGCGSGV